MRFSCRLVGECNAGCNYGSKNSLDYTYLSAAARHGAVLSDRSEVREIEPREGGGYTVVRYVRHEAERGCKTDTRDPAVVPHLSVTADRVVVSARRSARRSSCSQPRALPAAAEPQAGHPLLRQRRPAHVRAQVLDRGERRGDGHRPRYGPVITSAIRVPDELDGGEGRGFYVEDAGYPDFISWIVQAADEPAALWAFRKTALRLVRKWLQRKPESDLSAEISELFGRSELSAGVLPLLDGAGRAGRACSCATGYSTWTGARTGHRGRTSTAFGETMRELVEALGGRFVDNPLWWLSKVVTVHPLGGCPVGRTPEEGVVDSYGEAFGHGPVRCRRLRHAGPRGAQSEPHHRRAGRSLRRPDRFLTSVGTHGSCTVLRKEREKHVRCP